MDNKFNPQANIGETDMPETYSGKILIVAIIDETYGNMLCLRSGDLWHREILRNTKKEISNLGFSKSLVYQLGGASVRSESNGNITIYGTSADFGSCDKNLAAKLIRKRFPSKKIIIMN